MKKGLADSHEALFCPIDAKSGGDLAPRELALRSDFTERNDMPGHIACIVRRRRREQQSLCADGHSRTVDRLQIDSVIVHQSVASHLAQNSCAPACATATLRVRR